MTNSSFPPKFSLPSPSSIISLSLRTHWASSSISQHLPQTPRGLQSSRPTFPPYVPRYLRMSSLPSRVAMASAQNLETKPVALQNRQLTSASHTAEQATASNVIASGAPQEISSGEESGGKGGRENQRAGEKGRS